MLYLQYPSWIKPEIIPGFFVRWYGLMYIVAFTIALKLMNIYIKEKKELNADSENMEYVFFSAVIGLLLGGRIFFGLVYDVSGLYREQPWRLFWPFMNGRFVGFQGMSYHGALIGGSIGAFIGAWRKKISYLFFMDALAVSAPFGYTFGRLGNFTNGELYGRVTSVPWGMIFPQAEKFKTDLPWVRELAAKIRLSLNGAGTVNLPRHPSQLYEAFLEGILLGVFMWFYVRKKNFLKGIPTGLYFIGYGLARFIVEYFRQPDKGLDFPLIFTGSTVESYSLDSLFAFTTGQILSSLMILGGGLLIGGVILFHHKRGSGAEKPEKKVFRDSKGKKNKRRKK